MTPNRNTQAVRTITVALAALTYAAAVLYGDLMFLQVVTPALPTGFLANLAAAGAVAVAVSALILPLALHYWLAPGAQFIVGILYWTADVVVLALNAILAYGLATSTTDAWLLRWQDLSPATPLLAVVGWGLIFLLDPAHALRHAQAELYADQVDEYATQLRTAARTGAVHATIAAGANAYAAAIASDLTGRPVQALPAGEPYSHSLKPTAAPSAAIPVHVQPTPKANGRTAAALDQES